MERGPLPPHERTWRHPSELAAEERAVLRAESASPSMRGVALLTGTFGLLAVAVLVLTFTPGRPESPIAISATTTPAAMRAVSTSPTTAAPTAAPARSGSSAIALAPPAITSAMSGVSHTTAAGLATAIGNGRHALITARSLADIDVASRFHVQLPSGEVSSAEIVQYRGDDLVVISLAESYPGHVIATDVPIQDDIVMVMSHPPVTIAFADLDEIADLYPLSVAEGTAVFDRDGDLVGLCSHPDGDESVELIELDGAMNDLVSELDGATSDGR